MGLLCRPLGLTASPGLLLILEFHLYAFSWQFSYHVVQGFIPCFIVESSTFLCKASSGAIVSTLCLTGFPGLLLIMFDFYSYAFSW